ncbi:MAG: hypothetical protein HKN38_02845 [Altererythrobacter sp.]|nr:hypothetical protein [Altererythrobacter sp.]
MMAATICANGNKLDVPPELQTLATSEALEEAICWGLGVRLARRVGARSPKSLQVSRLLRDVDKLVLRLQESHRDLYGVPVEKDLKLLADRLELEPAVEIVPDGTVWETAVEDDWFDAAQ